MSVIGFDEKTLEILAVNRAKRRGGACAGIILVATRLTSQIQQGKKGGLRRNSPGGHMPDIVNEALTRCCRFWEGVRECNE